jgi:hypothetical protein
VNALNPACHDPPQNSFLMPPNPFLMPQNLFLMLQNSFPMPKNPFLDSKLKPRDGRLNLYGFYHPKI